VTLLLKNAHIISGGADEPFRGDILIHGDTISAIGNLSAKKTDHTIDCQGAYVAPGFIDTLSRADQYFNVISHPHQEHALEMGVSSMVAGYEGRSLAPLIGESKSVFSVLHPARGINIDWHTVSELFGTIHRIKPTVHFNTLIGYNALREDILAVHGEKINAAHIESIREVLLDALRAGALGISCGKSEISPAEETMIYDLVAAEGAVLALSHGPANVREKKKIESAIAKGAKVVITGLTPSMQREIEEVTTLGCYVIIPPSEFVPLPIASLLPDWVKEEGRDAAIEKLRDEWLVKKIMAELPEIDPKRMHVLQAPHHSPLVGLTLHEIMQNRGIKNAKECLVSLMKVTKLHAFVRFETPHAAAGEESDIYNVLKYQNVLIGSSELGSYPTHWRDIEPKGGFLKLLFEIESRGAMSIGEFIRKTTRIPAEVFGIKERGIIQEGMKADLIGFKNKTLKFVIIDGVTKLSSQ
jgi:N-acyl-D-amino-acid deacylase